MTHDQHSDSLDPLPSDIVGLLNEEKARPGPDPAARDRIFGGVAVALGMPHLMPDGGISGAGAGASAAGTSGGIGTSIGTLFTAKALIPFVIGAVAGVGGSTLYHQNADRRDAEPLETVAAPAAAPLEAPPDVREEPETITAGEPLDLSGVDDPRPVRGHGKNVQTGTPKTADDRPKRNQSLAEERTLIEMARTALSRGNGEDALTALRRHRKAHPRGKFVEEREALTIIALINLNQTERAHQKAAVFQKRYPKSMFSKTIDGALKKAEP
jgi:hypothetical protein